MRYLSQKFQIIGWILQRTKGGTYLGKDRVSPKGPWMVVRHTRPVTVEGMESRP